MIFAERLLQDTQYALRLLKRNPGFTLTAVLSLALGIGANTAIFSLIDSVFLRSMPVDHPEQLAVIARNPQRLQVSGNYPDYEYIRDHNKSFSGVVAFSGVSNQGLTVPDEGIHSEPRLAAVTLVSGNYFDVLGVRPAVGRLLSPSDNLREGAHPVAVLGYGFWQRRFAGDPAIVGRTISLNGTPLTVLGVTRSGFTGMTFGVSPDIFAPIMMNRQINRGIPEWNNRHFWWLTSIARLRPGLSLEAAIPEVDVLMQQIDQNDAERHPSSNDRGQRDRATLIPGAGGYSQMRNVIDKPLRVLMVIVGLVLLIACANVANLLIARATSRQREIAVRLAVGAARSRLVTQLLIETLVLSLLGGLAGLAFAWWGVRVLVAFMPTRGVPIALAFTPDLRILAFAFTASLIAGLACGLLPAIQATRPSLLPALKNELASFTRARIDLRRILMVAQVALSLMLLIGTGLFVRSLANLHNLDPGFSRENVLLAEISPDQGGYKGQNLRLFYEHLVERVQSAPGVRSVGIAAITPLAGRRWNEQFTIDGYLRKPGEEPAIDVNAVSDGFFGTMGIPLLAGRDFRAGDNPAVSPDPSGKPGLPDQILGPPAPVAIINETMASRFFGHENPLGRRFSQGPKFKMEGSFEIIGVVKDSYYFGLRDKVESMVYLPVWRLGAGQRTLCARSTAAPEQLSAVIRREAANLDRSIPVLRTLTMQQQFDNNIAQERMVTTLCSFFSGLALLLAAIGLYGVMANSVARRSREIGIRMALGARRQAVLWLVLSETGIMVLLGAAIGVPSALALTRFIQSFLYGLTPQDPVSVTLSVVVLFIATAIASYLPARRATRVDPMVALRYE